MDAIKALLLAKESVEHRRSRILETKGLEAPHIVWARPVKWTGMKAAILWDEERGWRTRFEDEHGEDSIIATITVEVMMGEWQVVNPEDVMRGK